MTQPPPKTNGSKTKAPKTWAALSESQLKQLGAELCRSRTRVDRLDSRGHEGTVGLSILCGRLVKQVLVQRAAMLLEKEIHKSDLYYYAAQPANRKHIRGSFDKSELGQFINGEPRKIKDHAKQNLPVLWLDLAWVLIELLLLGSDPNPDPPLTDAQRALAHEILEYFLAPRGDAPVYFGRLRRTSKDPFTRKEAYDGTVWLARRIWPERANGVVVLTSGEPAFMHSATLRPKKFNEFGSVTVELAERGLEVYFVYPDHRLIGPSQARDSAVAFKAAVDQRLDPVVAGRIHTFPLDPRALIDNPGGVRKVWAGEFLDPTAILTYVRYSMADGTSEQGHEPAEDLYISRMLIEQQDLEWTPFAYLASATEATMFREWFFAFQRERFPLLAEAAPPPTPPGSSPNGASSASI